MITRKRPAGDIDLVLLPNGKKDVLLVDGVERVLQKLAARFRFWLGEWFVDKREGFPWRESVFVHGANPESLRALFVRACTSLPEIERVEKMNLSIDRQNRTLAVNFVARLVSGEVVTVDPGQDGRFILVLPQAG